MAFINRPPVQTGSNVSTLTSVWSGAGRRFPIQPTVGKSVLLLAPQEVRSGARILSSGQYETTFHFVFEASNADTTIQIRGNRIGTSQGPTTSKSFYASTAGQQVSGSFKFFSNISYSEVLAGSVFILVEVASDSLEMITWIHSQISIVWIGSVR